MKKIEGKIFILYLLVIFYVLFSTFVLIPNFKQTFTYVINPISWLIIFIVGMIITKGDTFRFKGKKDKVQVVFITILIYLIIYFLSGLLLGYQKSPYAHTLTGYIKNFLAFFIVIIFREMIRSIFVNKANKNKYLHIIITIIFIFVELNFDSVFNSNAIATEQFKYFCSIVFPIIIKNILLTYLVAMAGYQAALSYSLPLMFADLVLPIFPALNWFVMALYSMLLTFSTFIIVNHEYENKNLRLSKRRLRKESPYKLIPLVAVIVVFVSFVAGFFKYMPVAIMSNSMKNLIERGDVVIIAKLSSKEIKELKIGDIIEYESETTSIIHRIIKIEKEQDELLFTTKGDANDSADLKKVTEKQIVGKAGVKIPKIGYPAVLLSELLKSKK